jgi:hypothetical protein
MLGQRTALALAALLAITGSTGCAGQDDKWQAPPESQGYRWIGTGEQGNFGSAYNFCRSTLRADTESERLQGGAGVINTIPGGPTTIPGYSRSTQGGARTDYSNRRQFWGCMESQGWAAAEPTVRGQPEPPKL